ncbi:hypothetical protein FJ444_13550 [Aestuariibacter sp. GS-14]|uniref:hypothetical protein n=1 Tax=Aestuariibacter sp. GS-14 TaxID=2590670 RepID=UPI001126508E|nr:hypothetical protein [Aestuariibacter sp. GS-14]TPV57412.1 hypothetical protein FJ444_13550 [Aestuariibacter sp. GS-14]
MSIIAILLSLLLFFPAAIAAFICAMATAFSILSPIFIIPSLLVSTLIFYIYYRQFQLCKKIGRNEAFDAKMSSSLILAISCLSGVSAILYMYSYIKNLETVVFNPDILFTAASISHTLASIVLLLIYTKRKA